MNSPQALYALRWLIQDTFRQAMAARIFWIMLGVSAIAIVFCLGVSTDASANLKPEGDYLYHPTTNEPLTGPTRGLGSISLMFGAFTVELARDREAGVRLIHVILGSWVAGALGLLAALVWTAGFVPESLQSSQAALLLTKPLPRSWIVVGKFVGVVAFVAFQAVIFFGGTWLALGLRTDVWHMGYLAGIPLLTLQFAAFYSVSIVIATFTRSTMACVVGSVLFWVVCLALNYGRHAVIALPELAPAAAPPSAFTGLLVELSYWFFPKPADFLMMIDHVLDARAHAGTISDIPEFAKVLELGAVDMTLGLLTALAFPVVMLFFAGQQLNKVDY